MFSIFWTLCLILQFSCMNYLLKRLNCLDFSQPCILNIQNQWIVKNEDARELHKTSTKHTEMESFFFFFTEKRVQND
ncbi:hypothetical protein DD606_24950 [Enterobacter cloacae complex sp. GF14B]|nr:hypothetical protein DD606_24950 [Enterobacter cloacae complex sp. GF14B]